MRIINSAYLMNIWLLLIIELLAKLNIYFVYIFCQVFEVDPRKDPIPLNNLFLKFNADTLDNLRFNCTNCFCCTDQDFVDWNILIQYLICTS